MLAQVRPFGQQLKPSVPGIAIANARVFGGRFTIAGRIDRPGAMSRGYGREFVLRFVF